MGALLMRLFCVATRSGTPFEERFTFRKVLKRSTNCSLRMLLGIYIGLVCSNSYGWGLRTHLWVGQQVITDVIDDCKIDVVSKNGRQKKYPVTQEICDAIRSNPASFRAGNLGPDAFPDPIVGQMTTHPGVNGGWATDRWIGHVLNAAKSPEELAFAYGFVSHASADIFAHSYVNHYAGDVFLLSDNETAVELRHFTLEKYIEAKTPVILHQGVPVPLSRVGISVPSRFVSSVLIYNESVAREYFKVKYGAHLAALHLVRGASQQSANASQKIVDGVAKLASEYYKLQAEQLTGLRQAKLSLEAAKFALKSAEEVLDEQKKIFEARKNAYDYIISVIERNPAIILGLTALIDEEIILAANILSELNRLNEKLDYGRSDLGRLQGDFNGLVARGGCDLVKGACRNDIIKVCSLPGSCPGLGIVCCTVEEVCEMVKPQDCADLEVRVNEATNYVNSVQSQINSNLLKFAESEARKAALLAKKAKAVTALLAAEAAKALAKEDYERQAATVEAQRRVVQEAQRIVAESIRLVGEAEDAIDYTKKIIGQVEDFAKRYNVVTLFFNNLIHGIDRAGDDYVEASFDSALRILTFSGDALEPYQKWLQCSLMSYVGVPWQLPFAYCKVKDKFEEVNRELEKLKASLPPILQWVIDPLGELQEEVMKKVRPEIWKAVELSADFVLKPPAGRFIHMLADPKLVTSESLHNSYSSGVDSQGKKLLQLAGIVRMVSSDMALSSQGELSSEKFYALKDSIVLSKLSLLDATQLNQLFRDFAGDIPTRYGAFLYNENRGGRFTLLLDAVRSIDGNHQWQAFGLPYPRSVGSPEPEDPRAREFGYNVHDHSQFGLRIFADPIARKELFFHIFSGPIEGALLSNQQLQHPPYTHPACDKNPFPRSVDDNGVIKEKDLGCVSNFNPAKWIDSFGGVFERLIYWLRSGRTVGQQ